MDSQEEEIRTPTKKSTTINESDIYLSPIYQLVPSESPAPTPDQTPVKPRQNDNDLVIPSNTSSNPSTAEITKRKIKISIYIVFFSVFLDMMGISVITPVLPFFGEQFGANSIEIGLLLTSYASATSLSTLIMGKFSDNFGRRPMILFSLFGTCIGFLITGFAQNITQLLIYRFITGLFGMSRPIAQAFITDITTDKAERDKYIAWSGATIGMAFVIGPGIGAGVAAILGLRAAFFTSSILGAIGFIFAYFLLIESHPKYTKLKLDNVERENVESKKADSQDVEAKQNVPVLIWILALSFFMQQFGWAGYISMWGLYLIHVYDFKVHQCGLVTVVYAIQYVLTAGVLYHRISKKVGQWNACLLGCALYLMMIVAVGTNYLWVTLCFMFFAVGIGESLVMSSMPNIASNYTNELNRGYIMGIVNGSSNLARVVGPLVHGVLFGFDTRMPFFVSAIVSCIAAIILFMLKVKLA